MAKPEVIRTGEKGECSRWRRCGRRRALLHRMKDSPIEEMLCTHCMREMVMDVRRMFVHLLMGRRDYDLRRGGPTKDRHIVAELVMARFDISKGTAMKVVDSYLEWKERLEDA